MGGLANGRYRELMLPAGPLLNSLCRPCSVLSVCNNHLFNVSLCVRPCVRPSVTDVSSRSSRSSGHLEGPRPIQQVQHPLSVSGEENEYHSTQRVG